MGIGRAKGSNYEPPHTYKAPRIAFAHEATSNGCNYDDAYPDQTAYKQIPTGMGFQNQRKKIKCAMLQPIMTTAEGAA